MTADILRGYKDEDSLREYLRALKLNDLVRSVIVNDYGRGMRIIMRVGNHGEVRYESSEARPLRACAGWRSRTKAWGIVDNANIGNAILYAQKLSAQEDKDTLARDAQRLSEELNRKKLNETVEKLGLKRFSFWNEEHYYTSKDERVLYKLSKDGSVEARYNKED